MNRIPIPFRQRRLDWLFVAFFSLNFFFITYVVDVEQLTIPDPIHYSQAAWPPPVMQKLIHSYGSTIDPLLMARPQWWKDTIWLDVIFYGPFYAIAMYAFLRGLEWIRIPAIFYSGMMFADVFIILGEEIAGPHASPHLAIVMALNLPWLVLPILLTGRLWKEHPFTTEASEQKNISAVQLREEHALD
ncbi:MAG: emopamil-binding family protein [Anaerolineales bacterium]